MTQAPVNGEIDLDKLNYLQIMLGIWQSETYGLNKLTAQHEKWAKEFLVENCNDLQQIITNAQRALAPNSLP